MSKTPNYFRESAVKSSDSSTAHLNQLIRIISPLPWLVLAAIYILLAAVVVWAIWGKVPTNVTGQGVLMVKQGSMYTATAPEGSGRVAKIMVIPGDSVKKGQVIAELEQADLRKQVSVSEDYLAQLKMERDRLSELSKEMVKQRQELIVEQNKILKKSISVETQNLESLKDLVKLKEKAYAKGIVIKEGVVDAKTEFNRSRVAIEQYRDRITQNHIDESDYIDRWQQQIRDLNLKIDEAVFQFNTLQEKLSISNIVHSPADGMVIGLQTSIGSMVKGGSPVISIASLGEGMDVVTFVPVQDGKRIKPGMTALISPSTIKREEFGSIHGEVKTVSQFPATKKAMMAVLQNAHLVDFLSKQGPPITVRIRLKEDPETYSRFAWSSSKGPQQRVTPGSLASVRITVREQRPLSLVIPAFRKAWEG